MLTESIKNKINELHLNTPKNVGVMFGNKTVNGISTNERVIVFTVEKKLPLNELPKDEVLPKTIEIDGITYKTDVLEVGVVTAFACSPTTLNNCYSWSQPFVYNNVTYGGNIPPANRNFTRPLQGGISLTSNSELGTVGTMGFIAVDTATQCLVGVTNNHVVIKDAFYTSQRNLTTGFPITDESSDTAYQPGESLTPSPTWNVGQVVRYVPINKYPTFNKVDGALISLLSGSTSNSVSIRQLGLTYTQPMTFATTQEIDSLLTSNPPLCSAGRTSGPKEGPPCGLVVRGIGSASNVAGYHSQGFNQTVAFQDLIAFSRIDSTCPFPIYPGDSGSALIANFNNVWKIIGLCFAGSDYFGLAARIDNVASELGIQAWDGTTKPFIDPTSIRIKTVPGGSPNKTITCNNTVYWQVGATFVNQPC